MVPKTKIGMARAGEGLAAATVAKMIGTTEWSLRALEYERRSPRPHEAEALERLFPGRDLWPQRQPKRGRP